MKYDLELITDERNSLSIIIRQIKKKSVVLEFGPANGRLTKYLKKKLDCEVYIVEIDEIAARDAVKYSVDAIVGDIEEYEWLEKWENVQFDYILFADVLEHLRDPQEVLSRTKLLLKDEGKVILSVPNVGHNSIMINLFNNIFNYTPLGLLDNTHIHLFAYNTLKEFCQYAGYFPVIEDAVYVGVGENEIKCTYENVNRDFAKCLKHRKYGNVYQFVFTLQKKEFVNFNFYKSDYRIKGFTPFYFFKIYLDRGEGWSEDNCIAYKVNIQPEIEYKVKLENSEEIRGIRIDPLDANGVFRVKKIQLADENNRKEYQLNECTHNEKIIDNILFSRTDDPQIIIKPVKLGAEAVLSVDIECLCTEISDDVQWVLSELISNMELAQTNIMLDQKSKEELSKKENEENTLYKIEIESKEKELEDCRKLLQEKNKEIIEYSAKLEEYHQKWEALRIENENLKKFGYWIKYTLRNK